MYVPLSTESGSHAGLGPSGIAGMLQANGGSSTFTSMNFVGMAQLIQTRGMPTDLYALAIMVVSILLLGALPPLSAGMLFIITDNLMNTVFFNPIFGGDCLFYQHLFWLF